MKFAVSMILLALAVCTSAAPQFPYPFAPYFAAPYAAPYAYAAYSAAPGSYSFTAAPAAYAYAPAPAAIAFAPAPATYTAINRGTAHTAPLPGHTESAASVNLEPAPGTA